MNNLNNDARRLYISSEFEIKEHTIISEVQTKRLKLTSCPIVKTLYELKTRIIVIAI